MERLTLRDADGDVLEITEVFGFGEPTAAVFIEVLYNDDHKPEAAANMNVSSAVKLRDWLTAFIERATKDGGTEADSAKLNPMNGRA